MNLALAGDGQALNAPYPKGTTTITWKATDRSGNTATCSFAVTVFNGCLQDDGNPGNRVLFYTTTGEYRFCCGGVVVKSGRGSVLPHGCNYTIQHNAADRRVLINVSFTTKTGNASVQAPPGTSKCTIMDRDILNNTSCTSCGAPVVQ